MWMRRSERETAVILSWDAGADFIHRGFIKANGGRLGEKSAERQRAKALWSYVTAKAVTHKTVLAAPGRSSPVTHKDFPGCAPDTFAPLSASSFGREPQSVFPIFGVGAPCFRFAQGEKMRCAGETAQKEGASRFFSGFPSPTGLG
jgi:hypothetical protein